MLEHRLRTIPLFRDLPNESLKSIAARLKRERYAHGDVVFRQGDGGDAMYLVESGQVQVIAEDTQQPLAYLGPGSFVGEIALLLGQPRSATLKVVIDAELWVLHKYDFDELLAEYPSIYVHLTREIGQRLVTTSHRDAPPIKIPLTAVWGDHVPDLALAMATESVGKIGIVSLTAPRAFHNSSSWGEPISNRNIQYLESNGFTETSFADDLSHQVQEFDYLLLILPQVYSSVVAKALDLSDHVVCFGEPPQWLKDNATLTDQMIESDGSLQSVQRIARRLTHRTVGWALSSGGSKTVAHIGVVRVFREAGIPVDKIAGSSGGALFGALVAAGWSDQELVEFARRLGTHNTFRNWDISLPPKAGLLKGRRARDLIEDWLEGRHFEDLEIPLYVVAADAATGQEVVFDSGSVADAVRASMSIPGVVNPWQHAGRFLLDGSIVNPMPATVLRDHGAHIVFGSSVVRAADDPAQAKSEEMPNFLQIMSNIISAMETERIKVQSPLVDVVIHPRAFANHSLDFSQVDTLIALGEEAARAQLAECQRVLKSPRHTSQLVPQAVP